MYEEFIPLHKTDTIPNKVPAGSEWELVCNECSFRARYTLNANQGATRLEILDIGDPKARHIGNHGSVNVQTHPDHNPVKRQHDAEETWLTPELRLKLSEILQGLD